MDTEHGRSPSGRATRPADQAAARLGDTASVPNAASADLAALARSAKHTDQELRRAVEAAYRRGREEAEREASEEQDARVATITPPRAPHDYSHLPFDRQLQIAALIIARQKATIEFAGKYLEDSRSELADSMAFLESLLTQVERAVADPVASAIEARRAETQGGSVEDESATRQGDAQC